MTELDTVKRAKMYVDKLANGVNPLTDQPVPENDTINQTRISRCLFFVSDILRRVIENGGTVGRVQREKNTAREPFAISQEKLRSFAFSETPISVTEITKRINDLIDSDRMVKLKYTSITSFLMESGLMQQSETSEGKMIREPTDEGKSIGIFTEQRFGLSGPYQVTLYRIDAQRFILDNIDAAIVLNQKAPKKTGLQGSRWTPEQDETLIDLYQKKVPIAEIARQMDRTQLAIQSRLAKNGFVLA